MDIVKSIKNENLVYWSWRGLVRAKFSSTARIGSSGLSQEIRVHAADKKHRTLVLTRDILIEKDDDVSLVYVRRIEADKGVLVGIVNHSRSSFLAMPQGTAPIKLRSPLLVKLLKRVERFSLIGAMSLLSSVAAIWLHFLVNIRFSLPTWILIGSTGLALLWSFTVLADWWEDRAARFLLSETEILLAEILYEGSFSENESGSEINNMSSSSKFLRGTELALETGPLVDGSRETEPLLLNRAEAPRAHSSAS
ncbi:hypothetical protein ACFOYU_27340 [Microvirga sp. GCM10011540]|uniref:hypothetical protein n=1 Tax=Microvirga sp. GCM10011540 TaxID=3317338 RepID=UPI00361B6F0F